MWDNATMRNVWLFALWILTACQSAIPHPGTMDHDPSRNIEQKSQSFHIHQSMSLKNIGDREPEKQNLWVALIRDIQPYQSVESRLISPSGYVMVSDEYENQYAEFQLDNHPAGKVIRIEIDYKITVYEHSPDFEDCEGELPMEYTQPELHIESANPQIIALASDLSKGKSTPCEKVRSFYDHLGDNLIYTFNKKEWGAQAALGPMGADCTEYASLMIALSRAEGIPARYLEGLLYLGGRNLEGAQIEHAWLEVYLPGIGWSAMDPTLGRSRSERDDYFGHHTTDHIIITMGRNPSTLRGSNYWSHLYWPGGRTTIQVEDAGWEITPLN